VCLAWPRPLLRYPFPKGRASASVSVPHAEAAAQRRASQLKVHSSRPNGMYDDRSKAPSQPATHRTLELLKLLATARMALPRHYLCAPWVR